MKNETMIEKKERKIMFSIIEQDKIGRDITVLIDLLVVVLLSIYDIVSLTHTVSF